MSKEEIKKAAIRMLEELVDFIAEGKSHSYQSKEQQDRLKEIYKVMDDLKSL